MINVFDNPEKEAELRNELDEIEATELIIKNGYKKDSLSTGLYEEEEEEKEKDNRNLDVTENDAEKMFTIAVDYDEKGNYEKALDYFQKAANLDHSSAQFYFKQFIHKILNQKEKPYRTVGCCYTIILFQLLNPHTKELSSPAWAFEELKDNTIQISADRFIDEINGRINFGKISWGSYFQDAMETEEHGELICNIIFGERFKRKDLENWSRRFRSKLKDEICYEFN